MSERTLIEIDRAHGGDFPADVLDFSASINPLGPPPAAIEAYHRAAASIARYPAPYARRIEARIANSLGVDADCVLAGNGTTQLIFLIPRVLQLRAPFVVI